MNIGYHIIIDAFLISEAKRYDLKGKKFLETLEKYYVTEYLMHEDLPIRTKGSGCF